MNLIVPVMFGTLLGFSQQHNGCQAVSPHHPQKTLDTAIPHAISLLESGEYERLFDQFLLPKELQNLKTNGKLKKSIKEFRDSDQPGLLMDSLKMAKTATPKFNRDKDYAFYSLKIADPRQKSQKRIVVIRFKKQGELWYLDL